jgi:choline-glycine betaine transporter
MDKHPDSSDHFPADSSSFEGLSKFPEEADDGPLAPALPNRMRTWAMCGVLWGAVCGAAGGVLILVIDLSSGSPDLLEALSVLLGAPVILAVLCGVVWGIRGAIRDTMMETLDLEHQRKIEKVQNGDRDWWVAKKILRQRGDNQ